MSGLSARYTRTGPLNPNRRPDPYDVARRVWGAVTPDLEALTRIAQRAGLRGLGWRDGQLVMHGSDGSLTTITTTEDVERLAEMARS